MSHEIPYFGQKNRKKNKNRVTLKVVRKIKIFRRHKKIHALKFHAL